MSDPLLQSTSIPIAGPSTRRKRSSETLDPSSSTTVPTNNNNNNHDDHHDDDDQDRPPARKRIATAESMSQDSGKVVDTQAGVDVFGVDGRETEHQQEQLQGTTRDSINDEQAAQDGRSESYHASLQKALDMAVRTGANRWRSVQSSHLPLPRTRSRTRPRTDLTLAIDPDLDSRIRTHSAIDLMKAYPVLSAGKDRKESFKGLWKRAADEMREKMIVSPTVPVQSGPVHPSSTWVIDIWSSYIQRISPPHTHAHTSGSVTSTCAIRQTFPDSPQQAHAHHRPAGRRLYTHVAYESPRGPDRECHPRAGEPALRRPRSELTGR